jgi:hypothetical protein
MKRRSLFLAIATGVLVAGFSAVDARAGGQIPLPTTLDQLLGTGNFFVTGSEPDTYSSFTYSPTPAGSPPTPANISITAFGPVGVPSESGITIGGAFAAGIGATVDYKISYLITAPTGSVINDALLSITPNLPTGTTGTISIGETFTNTATGLIIGSLQVSQTTLSDITTFGGANQILVQKDILLKGGSLGSGVSFINQAFSSTSVPEPASLALLGIGMTGFLAFRRFFKKTSVA